MVGVYDAAEAYEIAFSYRDVAAEVDALTRWAGAAPGSVLELAAGPADHAVEFARRGARAAALDLSPAMCARAQANAAKAGVPLAVHRADMADFRLGARFALACCMIDSIAHVLTLDALVSHLRCVRACLEPDGCYIVEGSHPAEYLSDAKRVETEWDHERDGRTVRLRWGLPDDQIDPVTQVVEVSVRLTVTGSDGRTEIVDGIVPNRFWTVDEMTAAARLAGLTVAARYGDFEDDLPLTDERAWRMITVLRPA